MTPLNQRFFDDSAERNRQIEFAGGYKQITRPNGAKDTIIRGGIWPMTEDKLRPGEVIFRVGHSNLPMTQNMSSPWWLRDESFYAICDASERTRKSLAESKKPDDRSERHRTSLGNLFRMKCAVSYDFGVADIVLQARVTHTLRVFAGHGRPVVDDSDGRKGQVWFGALEIAQMFVPGLRDFKTGFPTDICRQSIEITEKYKVSDYIAVERGRQRRFHRRMLADFDKTAP